MATDLIRDKTGDSLIIDASIFLGPNDYIGVKQGEKVVIKKAHEWSVDTLASVLRAVRMQMILDHLTKNNANAAIETLVAKAKADESEIARLNSVADGLQDQLNFSVDDGK